MVATLQAKKGTGEVRLCCFLGISSLYTNVAFAEVISHEFSYFLVLDIMTSIPFLPGCMLSLKPGLCFFVAFLIRQ